MTTAVKSVEITKIVFNHNASWMYIGDTSGRVLIWDLTKLSFRAEIWI